MDDSTFEMRVSVVRRGSIDMAREAHLEAAKHHLEAAGKHLAAVAKYNDGDVYGAEKDSEEAWAASQLADGKSVEAHRQATMVLKMKLII
jgi:predicted negative regulator of RcsB-dependent stress response